MSRALVLITALLLSIAAFALPSETKAVRGEPIPRIYCFMVEGICAAEGQDYLDDCNGTPQECFIEAAQVMQACEDDLYATCHELP